MYYASRHTHTPLLIVRMPPIDSRVCTVGPQMVVLYKEGGADSGSLGQRGLTGKKQAMRE